jgi:polyhydroxyalkanoate synthesis repressor PhaR
MIVSFPDHAALQHQAKYAISQVLCQYGPEAIALQQNVRAIRKYGNRRLYDTCDKRYVNLDEIAKLIRNGEEIQVFDAKSGDDITHSILTQIIMEDSKSRNGGLPLEILREIIRFSDRTRHEGLVWYLRHAIDTYKRAQQAPVDFMRNLFSQRGQDPGGQVDDLLRRVEELERQLEGRKERRR